MRAAIIGRGPSKARRGWGIRRKILENSGKTGGLGDNIGQYLVLNLDNLILQRQLAFFQPLDL